MVIASIAMGYDTEASGGTSTAMGNGTEASGFASTAMGLGTDCKWRNFNSNGLFYNGFSGFASSAGL